MTTTLFRLFVSTCLFAPLAGLAQNSTLLTTFTNSTATSRADCAFTVAAVAGNQVLIGEHQGAALVGTSYLLGTDGKLLTTFTNPTPLVLDHFGGSVAAVGSDRVLIGAYGDRTGAREAGA